jgi:hypothetical protein
VDAKNTLQTRVILHICRGMNSQPEATTGNEGERENGHLLGSNPVSRTISPLLE